MKAIVFGLCFAALFCALYFALSTLFQCEFVKNSRVSSALRKWYFLVRWFLIGKYHCEFKGRFSRSFFVRLHKALWNFIFFSCGMSVAVLIYFIVEILCNGF